MEIVALPTSTVVSLHWTLDKSYVNRVVLRYDVHLVRVTGEDSFLCMNDHNVTAITKTLFNTVAAFKNLEEFSTYTVTVIANLDGNLRISSRKNFTTLSAGRYYDFHNHATSS